MGVDALLWAKKSNVYYELDRDRNFRGGYWIDPTPLNPNDFERLRVIMEKVDNRQDLSCADVMLAAKLNIQCFSSELHTNWSDNFSAAVGILHNARIHEMANDIASKEPNEVFQFLNDGGDFDDYIVVKKDIGAVPHHVSNW